MAAFPARVRASTNNAGFGASKLQETATGYHPPAAHPPPRGRFSVTTADVSPTPSWVAPAGYSVAGATGIIGVALPVTYVVRWRRTFRIYMRYVRNTRRLARYKAWVAKGEFTEENVSSAASAARGRTKETGARRQPRGRSAGGPAGSSGLREERPLAVSAPHDGTAPIHPAALRPAPPFASLQVPGAGMVWRRPPRTSDRERSV